MPCENSLIREIARFCKLHKIGRGNLRRRGVRKKGRDLVYGVTERNFGESSIDVEEKVRARERMYVREREGKKREREQESKREMRQAGGGREIPHRRNSALGRTAGRIFCDAKIKARV